MESTNVLKTGTASGTILSILPNIFSVDIMRTIVLAAIGAIVSFTVTWLLNRIFKSKK